jgi:PHD-finger
LYVVVFTPALTLCCLFVVVCFFPSVLFFLWTGHTKGASITKKQAAAAASAVKEAKEQAKKELTKKKGEQARKKKAEQLKKELSKKKAEQAKKELNKKKADQAARKKTKKAAEGRDKPSAVSSSDSESDDGSGSSSDNDRLYCICHRPMGNALMLRCQQCKEWYHATCLGLKPAERKVCMRKQERDRERVCVCDPDCRVHLIEFLCCCVVWRMAVEWMSADHTTSLLSQRRCHHRHRVHFYVVLRAVEHTQLFLRWLRRRRPDRDDAHGREAACRSQEAWTGSQEAKAGTHGGTQGATASGRCLFLF